MSDFRDSEDNALYLAVGRNRLPCLPNMLLLLLLPAPVASLPLATAVAAAAAAAFASTAAPPHKTQAAAPMKVPLVLLMSSMLQLHPNTAVYHC